MVVVVLVVGAVAAAVESEDCSGFDDGGDVEEVAESMFTSANGPDPSS